MGFGAPAATGCCIRMARIEPNLASGQTLSSRSPNVIFLGWRGEGEMRKERFGFIRVIRIQPSVAAGEQKPLFTTPREEAIQLDWRSGGRE
jgi:hypothetical protein